ncbi:hypothetical protein [Sphingopyxis flava]|nr:hypothetical protein [Sphingopyxis flava]
MILELAVALELLQSGLSPSDASVLIKANRASFYSAGLMGIASDLTEESDPFVLISPVSMTGYPVEMYGERIEVIGAVSFVTRSFFNELFAKRRLFEPISGDSWRWLIVDVRKAMGNVLAVLTDDENMREAVFDAVLSAWERDASSRAQFIASRLNKIAELPIDFEDVTDVNP